MRTIIALVVCTFGFASATHAAVIASPTIFGGHTQTVARCLVINGGTEAITVTVRILNESGGVIRSTTATLAPFDFTVVTTGISSGVGYACTATAGSSLSQVRGAMVMEEPVDLGGFSVWRPFRSAALR